eukprot:g8008.t1
MTLRPAIVHEKTHSRRRAERNGKRRIKDNHGFCGFKTFCAWGGMITPAQLPYLVLSVSFIIIWGANCRKWCL